MKKNPKKPIKPNHIKEINKYVAGVDIGSMEHYIAVSPELTEDFVRSFGGFTPDLRQAAAWLKDLGIKSVAMESTGVYWIPLYEILEQEGLEVLLVNAHYIKMAPGRKSDVLDCQWIQQLHSCGLLRGSFRPDEQICALRGVMRQRETIVQTGSQAKLRMQKALDQMNIHLHHVISDITGDLGLKILRGIVEGNHDPKSLAAHRTDKYKSSQETIEKALEGNYRREYILSLKQSLDTHDFAQRQLQECDVMAENMLQEMNPVTPEIEATTEGKEDSENSGDSPKDTAQGGKKAKVAKKAAKKPAKKRRKNELFFDASHSLKNVLGVDLTEVPGLDISSALKLISEIGTDMSRWPSEKHFTSWLGLSPGTKISGGKHLSTRTKPCKNRAAHIFRMAAFVSQKSASHIGAFMRRKKVHLDTPEVITAGANKLAKIVYLMIKEKSAFKDLGVGYYEERYQERALKNLEKRAALFGLSLVKTIVETAETASSIVQNLCENVINVGGA